MNIKVYNITLSFELTIDGDSNTDFNKEVDDTINNIWLMPGIGNLQVNSNQEYTIKEV